MKVKTISGEIHNIQVGGALAGMALEEVTFTFEDAMEMFKNPHSVEWVVDVLVLRLCPTSHIYNLNEGSTNRLIPVKDKS